MNLLRLSTSATPLAGRQALSLHDEPSPCTITARQSRLILGIHLAAWQVSHTSNCQRRCAYIVKWTECPVNGLIRRVPNATSKLGEGTQDRLNSFMTLHNCGANECLAKL